MPKAYSITASKTSRPTRVFVEPRLSFLERVGHLGVVGIGQGMVGERQASSCTTVVGLRMPAGERVAEDGRVALLAAASPT